MKVFCGILIVTVLLHKSESASLVRNKRFFNSLWPSEVKEDVQTGLIYAQLPPGYVHLLPGVNNHLQKRADVQQPLPIHPPARFVHPTRMAILMQPHQQPLQQTRPVPPFSGNLKAPQPSNVQLQQGPKIVMRPVGVTTKLHPSITLKTKEQALPDKNQRFVQPKPLQNYGQSFNIQQQLPIKKAFDEQDFIESPTPLLSVHTAPIEDFYFTKEFQALLQEFNIKVDISKLPPIHDVMAVMGTETGQETIKAIEDVAKSSEGMELIKMYLDQSEGDEFYNYDDDVGAGEIQVGGTEDVKHVQPYGSQEAIPSQYSVPLSDSVPQRATTTGTLTGTGGGRSWWKPSSWFGGSAKSTRIDSLKKDVDIIKNVVPATGTENYLQYFKKLVSPAANSGVPINPPFNVESSPRRMFIPGVQIPVLFGNPASNDGAPVMPTIRLTEEQFQDMVEKLKLQPMHSIQQSHSNVPRPTKAPVRQAPQIVSQTAAPVTQKPSPVTETPAPLIQKSTTTQAPPQDKFISPINVPSVKSTPLRQELPLPSTFLETQALPFQTQPFEFQKGNRRSFVSVSEPQRSSPYDFIATGIIHKANEEEVKKRSRSLVEAAVEGEPDFLEDSRF